MVETLASQPCLQRLNVATVNMFFISLNIEDLGTGMKHLYRVTRLFALQVLAMSLSRVVNNNMCDRKYIILHSVPLRHCVKNLAKCRHRYRLKTITVV